MSESSLDTVAATYVPLSDSRQFRHWLEKRVVDLLQSPDPKARLLGLDLLRSMSEDHTTHQIHGLSN